jgi:hypothetical protein
VLTASEGGIIGKGVALASSSVSLPLLHIIFATNSIESKLTKNYNLLYSYHLILWFVGVFLRILASSKIIRHC